MIPPVLNDLRALAEMSARGVELDLERVRLSPGSPFAEAVASHVSFGNMGADTYVVYTSGRKPRPLGVIQARPRKNRPEADITFIAPALDNDPDAVTTWYRLLAEATNNLGELGCQRIYAQVPAGNGAEEVFRQAGFTLFAREDIYLLNAEQIAAKDKVKTVTLRRMRKRDAWNVLRLYTALTPRPVQQAEAMMTTDGRLGKLDDWWENTNGTSYIFERKNSTAGIVRVTRGRLASWVRIHLHPQARAYVDEIVAEAIQLVSKTRARPIYIAVRDYEGGIRAALAAAGFELQMQRSHMVKHTTVRVREAVPWLAPVLESPKIPAIHTRQHAREVEQKAA
jgi:hypothetical protein